jgi:hypothetical protein
VIKQPQKGLGAAMSILPGRHLDGRHPQGQCDRHRAGANPYRDFAMVWQKA